jgi:hypothetical protein
MRFAFSVKDHFENIIMLKIMNVFVQYQALYLREEIAQGGKEMTKEDKIMMKGIFCTLMRAIIDASRNMSSEELEKDYYRMAGNLSAWIEKKE